MPFHGELFREPLSPLKDFSPVLSDGPGFGSPESLSCTAKIRASAAK